MNGLSQLVDRIEEAATLPVIITEVLMISNDPRATTEELSLAVSKDPVLSAKVVRTVNSSFFGFVSKAKDLQTAIVRLGIGKLRNLALGLGVAKLFMDPRETEGYSRLNLWKHSVAVGTLNEILAKTVELPEAKALASEALLAGLVHDVGIILLDQHEAKRFRKLPELSKSSQRPLYEVEREKLGFDHQALGAEILKKWRFPGQMIQCTANHHGDHEPGEDILRDITATSELLSVVKNVGYSDVCTIPKEQLTSLVRTLGLTSHVMETVQECFDVMVMDALDIFTIEPGRAPMVGREAPNLRGV